MKTKTVMVSHPVHTRKVDREVARRKMDKAGITGKNDEMYKELSPAEKKHRTCPVKDHRSYFANNWREWVNAK